MGKESGERWDVDKYRYEMNKGKDEEGRMHEC
jgi:hypothetical protein